MMRSIRNIGICALLAGCTEEGPMKKEYTQPLESAAPIVLEHFSQSEKTLEGRITKVQPSHFSFRSGSGSEATTASHAFEYIILEDAAGRNHVLVYPFSKAVIESPATIVYRPLTGNSIDVKNFIGLFISPDFATDDNFLIEAAGIITKDGIHYK